METNPNSIWIVGNRSDAIKTAKNNGLRVVLLHHKKVTNHSTDSLELISYSWNEEKWQHFASELLKKEPKPIAILAPIEKSVLPVAYLNEFLDLENANSPQTALACTHKPTMKKIAQKADISCTNFLENEKGDKAISKQEIMNTLGLPMVLKTCTGSGSRGAFIVKKESEVPHFLEKNYMAERFVEGIECSVEALIQDDKILFQNITEYVEPKFANLTPASFFKEIQHQIFAFNKKVIKALGAKNGITHTEVFVQNLEKYPKKELKITFGEMALRPPGGYIMELLRLSYRQDFWQLWLDVFLGKTVSIQNPKAIFYSGLRLFYPEVGTIKSIKGIEEVEQIQGVERVVLSAKRGDLIEKREGTGQSLGHVILKSETSQEVKQRLEVVKKKLVFEIE